MERELEKYPLWREEKRPVSVLFADLCGYSEMCAHLDVEMVGKVLKEVHRELSGIVNRHGGIVAKVVGDCLMGIFGAPVSTGEEIARAGFAALEIKKWVESTGKQKYQIPGVKIGLNHGIVLTTFIEAGFTTDYTILGETVNTADQLYRSAKPGQILCPSHLAQKMEPGFYLEFREVIPQKGTGKPLGVYEVLRAKRGDEQFPLQPLVGRKLELAFCENLLNKSLSGKGQILGLLGSEGTGKKTFSAHILDMALKKGFITSSLNCYAFRKNIPFWVISQLIAGLLENENVAKIFSSREYEIMKDYFLRTEPFKEEVLEGQERKALLFSLAKKAFASVAEEKPLFFLISGYQNVDPLSQEFLFLFSYSLPRYPMCVLFTYTPGTEIPFRGKEFFTEISLKNWDIEEIEEAIKAFLVQMSGVKSFAYRILETTGGNPARVKSLLTYLQLSGVPKEGMGMMPEGKEQREWLDITAQMDRLSPQAKEVLVIASILPEEFSYRHLKRIVPEGVDLDKALLELQEQEFLRETRFSPEPYYAFHIQEVRRFIQSQLLSDQSRSLHLRAAEALEKIYSEAGEEYFSQIACHYEKAGEPALAFQYYLKAGQSALEKSAIKEAKKLFNSARNMLNSLPSPPSTFLLEQFYQGYGEVEESLGNYTAAEEHYRKFQEMAVQSGNKEKEIRAVLKLGDIMLFKGGLTHAEKLFHQAKQMCEEGNFVSCKAFAVTKLGRVGYLKGYTEGVKENLLEGLQLAQESKDRKTEAMAHNYLGLFLRRSGSPYEALKHFETAYAIYQEMNYLAGMANTLLNIGIAYDHLGNLEKDMEVNQKALRMGEDIGDLYVIASASQNIGVMLLDAYGKPREALPYLMKGWEIHRVMGTLIPQIQDLLNLGECYLHLGEIEKANLSYQEGLKLAREVNSLYWIVETQISIAELYIYSGAYSDAENLLKQIWKESQSPGLESLSRKIELLLTWCFIEQEKWDEADALLRQNAEYFENLAKMQNRLKYFRLKSRLFFHNGNVNETREWLEKASHLAKNSGRIYENHLADVLLFHLLGEGSLSEVENFLKENDLPFLRLQKFIAQAHSAKKKKQEKLYQNIASEAKALLFSLAQKIEKTTLRESFLSAYLRLLQ